MFLGISTACFYPMETEKTIDDIARLGFDRIEVFANCMAETSFDYIKELKKKCDDYGIKVVSFHPFTSFAEPFYFFTCYPRRIEEGVDFYKGLFERAARLGAHVVNFHGAKRDYNAEPSAFFDVYARLYEGAKQYDIIFSQENVVRCKSAEPSFIKLMRSYLNDECSFTLDIKQANRAGFSPFEMLEAMGDKVCNVHINDFNSEYDCLLPGKGNFDFGKLLHMLNEYKYNENILIEVYRNNFLQNDEILSSKNYINNYIFNKKNEY